jgi:hypothetical protein
VATTQGKRACPVCGTLVPDDDSAACPVCLLRGALETQSDSARDDSSELRFEHYRVLQNSDGTPLELGRGAMGITYKAFDVHLQYPVALKLINAKFFYTLSGSGDKYSGNSTFEVLDPDPAKLIISNARGWVQAPTPELEITELG